MNGPLGIGSWNADRIRPATRADFDTYNIGIEQFEHDSGRYEIPAA